MKKIFTLFLLMLAFVTTQASALNLDRGNEERLKVQAIEQTRELATKLGLNEADYIRVKNIIFQKLVAIQAVEAAYAKSPEQLQKKMQAVTEEYNQQIAGALSAKQHKMYLALASAD
ncbi:hypothetical protein HUW51_09730 [Adhaeribacter swui]|uniref:Uncharacterized protein n=1 Tax=Adhaeribacter swui TaxID=2086471 RepID=A0A7G7G766_9BACT|nr:hypothetical protein [Adhaeribacter swui]QNF33000.1 hypothetical protein HUW51_09730 [Adhaeribacter swui]